MPNYLNSKIVILKEKAFLYLSIGKQIEYSEEKKIIRIILRKATVVKIKLLKNTTNKEPIYT